MHYDLRFCEQIPIKLTLDPVTWPHHESSQILNWIESRSKSQDLESGQPRYHNERLHRDAQGQGEDPPNRGLELYLSFDQTEIPELEPRETISLG